LGIKIVNFDELFDVIVKIVTKQLDEVEKKQVTLSANLVIDYEADSVDVVAMLLYLEDMFKTLHKQHVLLFQQTS
jgi:acyl carrier protein